MLIATFERREATIVEVKLSMSVLLKALESPRGAGKSLGPDTDRHSAP
jgi:hypothetical protein